MWGIKKNAKQLSWKTRVCVIMTSHRFACRLRRQVLLIYISQNLFMSDLCLERRNKLKLRHFLESLCTVECLSFM